MDKQTDNYKPKPVQCLHLIVVMCNDEDCPKPNNHFFCGGCNRNINLPEVHTYFRNTG